MGVYWKESFQETKQMIQTSTTHNSESVRNCYILTFDKPGCVDFKTAYAAVS